MCHMMLLGYYWSGRSVEERRMGRYLIQLVYPLVMSLEVILSTKFRIHK